MDELFPKIIWQWLGEQRIDGNESFDKPTEQAANICGKSQAASRTLKSSEPINRKERSQFNAVVRPFEEIDLKLWAKNNGFWICEQDFLLKYKNRKIGAGAEQQVYLHENGFDVIKANTGTYHGNWLEFFIRLLCHAILFLLQNTRLLVLLK